MLGLSSYIGSRIIDGVTGNASGLGRNVHVSVNRTLKRLASQMPFMGASKDLSKRHSAAKSTAPVLSQSTHTQEGPSALTKTSTLKSMLDNFGNIAAAVLGGLIAIAGLYLILQSTAFVGVPLILLGGFMILLAYELYSDAHLFDIAKMQNASQQIGANASDLKNSVLPKMRTVADTIDAKVQSCEQSTASIEAANAAIQKANQEITAMLDALEYNYEQFQMMHNPTRDSITEAFDSLHHALAELETLEAQHTSITASFRGIMNEANSIPSDPKHYQDLESKMQQLQSLPNELDAIAHQMTAIRKRMKSTILTLQATESEYEAWSQMWFQEFLQNANAVRNNIHASNNAVDSVSTMIGQIQASLIEIRGTTVKGRLLITEARQDCDAIMTANRTLQEELDRYKARLSDIKKACASNSFKGGIVGGTLTAAAAAFFAPVAIPVAAAVGTSAVVGAASGSYLWTRFGGLNTNSTAVEANKQ